MFNTILILHIALGILSITSTLFAALAVFTYSKYTELILRISRSSLITVTASGLGLILLGGSLIKVCMTLIVYVSLALISLAWLKQKAGKRGLLIAN